MNTKPVFHGSDIEKICEYYHLNQEDIVNFGANVNPIGISTHVKQVLASHLDLLSSYPDRDYQSLRNTVSEYCGVPADYVLPGNGSSELISLLIETRAPKRTLLLGPTYSEYSRELSLSNSKCNEFLLKETVSRSLPEVMIFLSYVIRTILRHLPFSDLIWNVFLHFANSMTSLS